MQNEKRKSLIEKWKKWWNAPQSTYDYDPEDQSTQNLANIARDLALKKKQEKKFEEPGRPT